MGFCKDRESGEIGENTVINLINSVNKSAFFAAKADGRKSDVKVFFDDTEATIECKFDIYEAKSGNIAIEYFNPKSQKLSGIGSCCTDLWAHVLTNPTKVYLTATKKLVDWINKNKPHKHIKKAGDGNASLYLYKSVDIIKGPFVELTAENAYEVILENVLYCKNPANNHTLQSQWK